MMADFKKIDWNKEDVEAIFSYLDTLPKKEDYLFLKWLGIHYPKIEIDWVETFYDIRDYYSQRERIDLCEDFISWFPNQNPKEYAANYTFVERDLCLYYLIQQQDEKLKTRLDYCLQNPEAGLEAVLIPVYFGLLVQKKGSMAQDLIHGIYQYLTDESELLEDNLIFKNLYLNLAQETYKKFRETGVYDKKSIYHQLETLKLNIDKDIVEQEEAILSTAFNLDEFLEESALDYENGLIVLNIRFMQYMFDHHGFSFGLSDEIWSLTMVKGVFGSSQYSTEFYYPSADELEYSIQFQKGYFTNFNAIEIIAKVFGLAYVFEFLHEMKLLSAESLTEVKETLRYFQQQQLMDYVDDLWKVDFIFDWHGSDFWNVFRERFKKVLDASDEEVFTLYDDIENSYKMSSQLEEELEIDSKRDRFTYQQPGTYQRAKEKIGRNDPCPCGSGKKFKKCCMGKGIYE